MYVAATQHILGVRAELDGLRIDPCIPAEWEGYRVSRRFRGCLYEIEVRNESGSGRGVREIRVNGEAIEGTVLPAYRDRESVRVEVVL